MGSVKTPTFRRSRPSFGDRRPPGPLLPQATAKSLTTGGPLAFWHGGQGVADHLDRRVLWHTSDMRNLQADEAEIGLPVLYAGERTTEGIEDVELLRLSHILEHHHPGLIRAFYGPGANHCIVEFIGLEHTTVSTAVGFDHDERGHFPGLLVPDSIEWTRALNAGWWSRPRHVSHSDVTLSTDTRVHDSSPSE